MRQIGVAAVIALTVLGCCTSPASAAPGSLSFVNRVAAALPTVPLTGARFPAVSPDGRNVYASGQLDNALVSLTRDPETGALSFLEADTDAGPATLLGPLGVAVAPGGDFVYVAANQSDALVTFSRDPSTGALAHVESLIPGAQLDAPQEIVLSPDGSRAYVSSALNSAIDTFSRDPDGSFSFVERLTNGDQGGTVTGMGNTTGVTLSEDGRNVYVTNFNTSAVVSFAVEPDGTLDHIDTDIDAVNMFGPRGLDVSPDGANVYVGAENSDRVVTFARAADGTLTETGVELEGANGVPADTLNGVREAVVSPNGKQLYVSTSNSDAISIFDRDVTTGALTYRESVRDGANGVDGINSPGTMTLDPSGGFLYAAGFDDNAVAGFAREPEPVVQPDTDPPETAITKGPKKKTKKRKAKFEFSSDEPGSSFQCKLDKGDFEPCDPSEAFKVTRRKHALEVRAVDPAGNVDPTPAERHWKVKKKKPK